MGGRGAAVGAAEADDASAGAAAAGPAGSAGAGVGPDASRPSAVGASGLVRHQPGCSGLRTVAARAVVGDATGSLPAGRASLASAAIEPRGATAGTKPPAEPAVDDVRCGRADVGSVLAGSAFAGAGAAEAAASAGDGWSGGLSWPAGPAAVAVDRESAVPASVVREAAARSMPASDVPASRPTEPRESARAVARSSAIRPMALVAAVSRRRDSPPSGTPTGPPITPAPTRPKSSPRARLPRTARAEYTVEPVGELTHSAWTDNPHQVTDLWSRGRCRATWAR